MDLLCIIQAMMHTSLVRQARMLLIVFFPFLGSLFKLATVVVTFRTGMSEMISFQMMKLLFLTLLMKIGLGKFFIVKVGLLDKVQ